MPIRVPRAQLDHLHNAPLKAAIAQVRYAPVHAVDSRESIAQFEAGLPDRYVAEDPQMSQAFTVAIGPGGPLAPAAQVPADTVWPFRDDERGWSVAVSTTSLSLESTQKYGDFDDFITELTQILTAFEEVFHPKRRIRLGLRFINRIEDKRLRRRGGITHFVRDELLSPVGGAAGADLLNSLSELRFRERHGIFVLRHGLLPDAAYLLDYDYFAEDVHEFDATDAVQTVKRFHNLIERVFVWSLSDKYLTELKRST
jgi:uncharacterized protein (TIGR04255 family)